MVYYRYKDNNGKKYGLVKYEDGLMYSFRKGKWVESPDLYKIRLDDSDYVIVTNQEAEKVMKETSK